MVEPPYHTKHGPNGPALQSSPLDIVALTSDDNLIENIMEYADLVDHESLYDMLEENINMKQ